MKNRQRIQWINENSQKNLEFVEILFKIGRCFENCHWLILIFWKFGWTIEIFVENLSTFLQINENFIRWFVEFVDEFSNQYLFVDFVFQINEFNEINIFFNENESTNKYFQRKNIFLSSPGCANVPEMTQNNYCLKPSLASEVNIRDFVSSDTEKIKQKIESLYVIEKIVRSY